MPTLNPKMPENQSPFWGVSDRKHFPSHKKANASNGRIKTSLAEKRPAKQGQNAKAATKAQKKENDFEK